MNKKKIEVLYEKKLKLLEKYNKEYYIDSNPSVLDKEYDFLKKDILSLEKKYNFLKSKNSPSRIVGHKPSKNFKKVDHKVPMLFIVRYVHEELT